MNDPAVVAQRQQVREQSLIATIITSPFRLFGVLCGSLMLSILIEWIGMHLFWPAEGWHHAHDMVSYELDQLSTQFIQSLVIQEPGRTAHRVIDRVYEWLFIKSGFLEWMQKAAADARGSSGSQTRDFRHYLSLFYVNLEDYLIAAAYTLLVFLVRLLVMCLTIPLFIMTAFVGLVDGMVRRDVRRFEAGHESGFVYHRAKATLMPLIVLPWTIYLALPISISPILILLPTAILLGVAVDVAVGSFKKYL